MDWFDAASMGCVLIIVVVLCLGGVGSGATDRVAAQATNTTNATHHENPNTVGEQGDTARVRGWLARYLTEQLRGNSIQLSQDQYELAARLLGDSYNHRFAQFVDVTGATIAADTAGNDDDIDNYIDNDDSSSDDTSKTAQAFKQAQADQRALTSISQTTVETYQAYQSAHDRNNTAAARRHARKLGRLARRAQQHNQSAQRALRVIANQTGEPTADIRRRIQNETEEIVRLQTEVERETFVGARLEIRANRSVASFVHPVRINGRLTTRNGTAIADRAIRLRIGNRTYTTTTSSTGAFTVTYRPVLISAATETLNVRYRPAPTAPYAQATATTPLQIQQLKPTIETRVRPTSARFADTVDVTTRLTIANRSVPRVPIATMLGTRDVGRTRTTSDGTAQITGYVPAAATPPDTTVTSRVTVTNRAVASVNATTLLSIQESSTSLSVTSILNDSVIRVTGRLTAGSDTSTAVPAQQVVLRASTLTRTVQTDTSGRYAVSIPRSALATDTQRTIRIQAQFEASDTNLQSATANTTLTIPANNRQTNATSAADDPTESAISQIIDGAKDVITDAVSDPSSSLLIRVSVVLAALIAVIFGLLRWRPDNTMFQDTIQTSLPDALTVDLQLRDKIGAHLPTPSVFLSLFTGGILLNKLKNIIARVQDWRHNTSDDTTETSSSDASGVQDAASSPSRSPERVLLSQAWEAVEDDAPTDAVIAAYTAARTSLTTRFDLDETATSRELVAAGKHHLDTDSHTALLTLTELYERTVYASENLDSAPHQAVEAAQTLLVTDQNNKTDMADD